MQKIIITFSQLLYSNFNSVVFFSFLMVLVAQSCSFPGSPAHSHVEFSDDSLESGTIASYTCERGFELLGPARRVCDNGQWTPDGIPFCGKSFQTEIIFLFCELLLFFGGMIWPIARELALFQTKDLYIYRCFIMTHARFSNS